MSSGLRRSSLRDETVRAVGSEVLHGLRDRSALSKNTNQVQIPLKVHIILGYHTSIYSNNTGRDLGVLSVVFLPGQTSLYQVELEEKR